MTQPLLTLSLKLCSKGNNAKEANLPVRTKKNKLYNHSRALRRRRIGHLHEIQLLTCCCKIACALNQVVGIQVTILCAVIFRPNNPRALQERPSARTERLGWNRRCEERDAFKNSGEPSIPAFPGILEHFSYKSPVLFAFGHLINKQSRLSQSRSVAHDWAPTQAGSRSNASALWLLRKRSSPSPRRLWPHQVNKPASAYLS